MKFLLSLRCFSFLFYFFALLLNYGHDQKGVKHGNTNQIVWVGNAVRAGSEC